MIIQFGYTEIFFKIRFFYNSTARNNRSNNSNMASDRPSQVRFQRNFEYLIILENILLSVSDQPIKRKSTAAVFKEIYSQYGFRGLFAGTAPRLIKVAPACAIMISSFEYGKIFFNRLANQQYSRSIKVSEPDVSTTSQRVTSNKSVSSFKDRQVLSKRTEEVL